MQREANEVHLTPQEASAGEKPGIVRYVLLISLVLAIAALSAIWITGAVTTDGDNGGIADSQRAAREMQQSVQ